MVQQLVTMRLVMDGIRICEQVTRRWTATDQFQNTAISNQIIDIVDDYRGGTEGPNFLSVMEAGSPYFQAVGTVSVSPLPHYQLSESCSRH